MWCNMSAPPLQSKPADYLLHTDTSAAREHCRPALLLPQNERSSFSDEDEGLSDSAGTTQRIKPGVKVILELIRSLLAVG